MINKSDIEKMIEAGCEHLSRQISQSLFSEKIQ
jgi:hypothetical protein